MKLRLAEGCGRSWNGNELADDEFAFAIGNPSHNPSFPDPYEIILPCRGGKFSRCILRIHRGEPDANTATFKWNGNYETPTLSPSIGCDVRCGWHGHLIDGDMTP